MVLRDRLLRAALAKLFERLALPSVLLSNVASELDREPTLHEPAERPTRLELRKLKLVVVTDEHQLPANVLHPIEEQGQITSRHHPRLVHDQHRSLRHPAIVKP